MPPRKRERLLAAVPDAERAIAYLHDQGETAMAEAVQTTLDYANDAAASKARQEARDKKAHPTKTFNLGEPFLDHVRAQTAAQGIDVTDVVLAKLTQFIEGKWVPEKPVRARHGQAPEKGWLSIRVADELWGQADALAKDPAASEERGYKLNARQVVIAALHEEFPMPEPKKKTTARR